MEIGDDELEDFNYGRGRHPGMPDRGDAANEFLAEALGISVEELQEAQDAASQAALDQALADGLITQEQYDRMVLGGVRFHGRVAGDAIDYQALLAEALGIDVEELEAAQDAAHEAAIEQALADGTLTQEQVDMMRAREALRDYMDPKAILAEALGLTEAELDAAREDGKSLSDLLSEQGLTAVEVREAMEAAHEAAIQQAVEDGVITAEQAELFKNGYRGFPSFAPEDCMRGGGGGGRRGPGSFPGMGAPNYPEFGTGSDL
jgi:protein-disulfide isomerase-like protein with CxxC motif